MGHHAIVIGASMGGLTAAAVLAQHFEHVTVLDRDRLPGDATPRNGVPQGGHVHNLLSRGDATLGRLFPTLFEQLQRNDAQRVDWSRDVRWHHHGVWKKRIASGVESWFMTRPMLEQCVRQDLINRPNVHVRDGVTVSAYQFNPDNSTVTGVQIEGEAPLGADLVVDCAGRRSGLSDCLAAHGYTKPKTQRIKVDVVYSTCMMRPRAPQDFKAIAQIAPPPGKRSGVTFAVENGNWMVTLFGYHGDHPPRDPQGWRDFARSLNQPDIAALIDVSEPVTDIRKYHFTESLWRRFDKLARLPERLVHLGDSVCSFNPIYGQGMTSATLQAEALGGLLGTGALEMLHTRAPRPIANVINECWQAVASEDFRHPETTGDAMPGANIINWYTRRVHRLASRHDHIETKFLRVMHMEAGFASLFHPSILAPALFRPV
ncbi:MAG: FAD-dependent monooxygenase [Pseudomonadota bacterium]